MKYLKHLKRFNTPMYNYVGLTLIFYILVAILPASSKVMKNYNISIHEYHILLFIVELPLAAIWFAAFYGYARLRDYANSVSETAEGYGFGRLALGCQWLVLGLIVPSIISLILSTIAYSNYPEMLSATLIVTNYLDLIFPFIAFIIIAQGAHSLVLHSKLRLSENDIRTAVSLFVFLGVIYCYLTFRHINLLSLSSSNNPYYLPVWLLLLTIIIPYLYAWFTGLLAAFDLGIFAKHSKGVLYRRSLRFVASGLTVVIASLIGVQYLHIVIPRSGHLSLNTLLVTVYLIYVINVIGFVFISIGAYRLKKIEDI